MYMFVCVNCIGQCMYTRYDILYRYSLYSIYLFELGTSVAELSVI